MAKVTAVPEGVDYIPGAQFSVGGDIATRFQTGYEIGYFFGYETAGIFQTQDEIDTHAIQDGNGNTSLQPGDVVYEDLNGDNIIDVKDILEVCSKSPGMLLSI